MCAFMCYICVYLCMYVMLKLPAVREFHARLEFPLTSKPYIFIHGLHGEAERSNLFSTWFGIENIEICKQDGVIA